MALSAGLQCFSPAGNLVVDITDNLCRFIGQTVTGTADGALTVPEFSSGRGFVYTMDSGGINPMEPVTRPMVELTPTGFKWTFPSGPPARKSLPVIYGVY